MAKVDVADRYAGAANLLHTELYTLLTKLEIVFAEYVRWAVLVLKLLSRWGCDVFVYGIC